jgi:hypothetical protein
MKLLFENWRRYLKEIERPGPGHTNSRYEQTAGPIAFDGFAKAADAGGYGNPGGFLEENKEGERAYTVVRDDGNALYFEDDIKKEFYVSKNISKDSTYIQKGDIIQTPSPFIKELVQALPHNVGFTYAGRLAQKPDGSTDSHDQPVFLYNGNRRYVDILKDIASKHGITINETPI